MKIPKNRKKIQKLFIELKYLERNHDFSGDPIIYSYDLDLSSGNLSDKTNYQFLRFKYIVGKTFQ